MRCWEATDLGFVCFVVINPRVLVANRVDFGLFWEIFSSILKNLSLSRSERSNENPPSEFSERTTRRITKLRTTVQAQAIRSLRWYLAGLFFIVFAPPPLFPGHPLPTASLVPRAIRSFRRVLLLCDCFILVSLFPLPIKRLNSQ